MKKILCPIDFSDASINALSWALGIARETNSNLILFHAVHLRPPIPGEIIQPDPDLDNEVENAKDKLESICEQLAPEDYDNGVLVGFNVSIGFAVDGIKSLVKNDSIDLIVMGTRGKDGIDDRVFGTNTIKVIEGVDCPVLAIPKNKLFEPLRNIVFATNIDQEEAESIDYVVRLAEQLNAHLYFLNVQEETVRESKELIEKAISSVVYNYTYKRISFHVLEKKEIVNGINYFAEQKEADLIVMSTHKRNFLQKIFTKSLTNTLVADLKVPVLAMHFPSK